MRGLEEPNALNYEVKRDAEPCETAGPHLSMKPLCSRR